MAHVKLTLFSLDEANALARSLKQDVAHLVAMHGELGRIETAVAALSLATAGADASNPDAIELAKLSERRDSIGKQIAAGVRAIHERGALVKDLERGLLDFYALSGDRLIFLCWQLDEPEISHWHTLEGGFSSRQPLNRTQRD